MNWIIKLLLFLLVFSSCSKFNARLIESTRDKYYKDVLTDKLRKKVKTGDSVTFFCTLYDKFDHPWEKGLLKVKYENSEYIYYEIGEWITFDYTTENILLKGYFDENMGLVENECYEYKNHERYVSSTSHRYYRNDSLIQIDKHFFPSGQLRSILEYFIIQNYHKKYKHWEQRVRIGIWKEFDEEGNLIKTKSYL